jgi:hypothetical protein
MPQPRSFHDRLFDLLAQLRRAWPAGGWSWDNRFMCVASTISIETTAKARVAASIALPHAWTERTLAQAPLEVRQIAELTGGVRENQLVLASPAMGDIFAWGLWWPWRDGNTVSMRVGLGGNTNPRLEMRLSETFGAWM